MSDVKLSTGSPGGLLQQRGNGTCSDARASYPSCLPTCRERGGEWTQDWGHSGGHKPEVAFASAAWLRDTCPPIGTAEQPQEKLALPLLPLLPCSWPETHTEMALSHPKYCGPHQPGEAGSSLQIPALWWEQGASAAACCEVLFMHLPATWEPVVSLWPHSLQHLLQSLPLSHRQATHTHTHKRTQAGAQRGGPGDIIGRPALDEPAAPPGPSFSTGTL